MSLDEVQDPTEDSGYQVPATGAPAPANDSTPALASVFADPQDLKRYHAAIAGGATEKEALAVGDNGEGAWGDDTTSHNIPMVGLPSDTPGLKHGRMVEVDGPQGKVIAKVADKMPSTENLQGKANIDLNPAAAYLVGHPGGVTPVSWKWADGAEPTTVANTMPTSVPSQENLAAPILANAQLLNEPEDTTTQGSLGEAAEPGTDPQDAAQEAQENAELTAGGDKSSEAAPPPPAGGYTVVGKNPDGTLKLENGASYNTQDNSLTYNKGSKLMWSAGPGTKPVDITPKTKTIDVNNDDGTTTKKLINATTGEDIKDLGRSKSSLPPAITEGLIKRHIDPYNADGTPMSPEQAFKTMTDSDTANGVLTPQQDATIKRAQAQMTSGRNPWIRPWAQMAPNYQSVMDNVNDKPDMNQRTGTDDAALLSAYGLIELGGRATTANDFATILQGQGYRGNIERMSERLHGLVSNDPKFYNERGTRILSDAQVSQIGENAQRAAIPRYAQFANSIAPIRKQFAAQGIDENTYFPGGLLQPEIEAKIANKAAGGQPQAAAPAAAAAPSGQPDDLGKVVGQPYTDKRSGITKIYRGNGQYDSPVSQNLPTNPF
jgi:hypothetical protein